jgi:hypothetical protein
MKYILVIYVILKKYGVLKGKYVIKTNLDYRKSVIDFILNSY